MHKAPGRSERNGITLFALLQMFSGRRGGGTLVRGPALGGRRTRLPEVRVHEYPSRQKPQAYAFLV